VHRIPARLLPLVLFILLSAACARSAPVPQSAPGGPAPSASVERFMRLAAEKNYAEMGWVFGTAEGSVYRRDKAADVERRMYALGSVLRHDRFEIRDEAQVPGRAGGAVRMTVRLTDGPRQHSVPITTVRGPDGRWFVEAVDVEAVTGASRR
jgi:hypothetical protein